MPMLDELLSVKEFREKQADAGLHVARVTLADANRTEQQATVELEDYQHYAREQEEAGYQALFARLVKVRDISDLHQDIAILRATEGQYRAELDRAQEQRESAQQAHLAAQRTAHEARAVRSKFVELVKREHVALVRSVERSEELEYEELSSIVRERDDWSEPDR